MGFGDTWPAYFGMFCSFLLLYLILFWIETRITSCRLLYIVSKSVWFLLFLAFTGVFALFTPFFISYPFQPASSIPTSANTTFEPTLCFLLPAPESLISSFDCLSFPTASCSFFYSPFNYSIN